MKTIFNRTWVGNYIGTEETTLCQLDDYNKTRYSRRKKQEGLLELASREAHDRQAVYFATTSTMMVAPTARWSPTSGTSGSTSSEINTKTICYTSIGKMSIVGSSS